MSPLSRRCVLAATGSISAVIAGCSGSESGSVDNATEGGEPLPSDEFDVVTLRSDDDERFVYPSDEPPSSDDHVGPDNRSVEFVLSTQEASDLEIDAPETEEARSFLDATDFDSESIIIEQRSIDDCYRRHLLSVQARSERIRTQYCRRLKPATAPCEADLTVMKAVFIRVQHAYDERPSRRSSGEHTSCPDQVYDEDRSDAERENETQQTEETDG